MTPSKYISPRDLAKRWGVAPDKVLQLIHSGQLRAVNLAINSEGVPRFRISEEEIKRFEASRTKEVKQ